MRWKRIVFWIMFSALTLIVLALSWLWTADLGVFRPQLERFVTEQSGREFSINGAFHVDLAGQTTIIAEDVRFGNPGWAEAEDMITVGRAEVRFDLWSLIKGPVLIELVDIDDTDILLLNPGDSDPNWKLPIETRPGTDKDHDESGLDVLVELIDVDRLRVRLESAERERPLNLLIKHLNQEFREDDFLDLQMDATLDGKVVRIDGQFGTWDALLAGKEFDVDVDAVLDTFTLSTRGRVDDIANLLRPEFEFTASGPDVDDLTRLLGLGEEGEGDINLTGSLKPITDGPLALNVKGNIGLTQIDAHGELADLQSYENLRLRAIASGPDLGRILRIAGIHQVRESPFMLNIDAEMIGERLEVREATMVFAEARLEGSAQLPRFPSVDDATISLRIDGPRMERFRYIAGLPGAATGPFSLGFKIEVQDDGAELFALDTRTSLGELQANGSIGDPDTLLGTEVTVRLRTESLSTLAAAYGVDYMPDKPAEVAGAAKYTADGLQTNGPVSLVIDGDSASVDGLVTLRPGIRGTDLAVRAAGGDLKQLVAMFAHPVGVPALPFDIEGRLQIGDDGFGLSGLEGSLGSASISGRGLLVPVAGIAGSHFDFAAEGPGFEDLLQAFGDLRIRPGPFELTGRISFRRDAIQLSKVALDRQSGDARLDLTIGIGRTQRYFDFDVGASGTDVRSILSHIEGFEAFEQPFSIDVDGTLRGAHWNFGKLDVLVGDATIKAGGDLEFVEARATSAFSFELDIPSLAAVGTIDGRRFHDQALSLTAHVRGGDGKLAAEGVNVRIGDSNMEGSILFRQGKVPEIEIELHSDRLMYRPLLEGVEEPIEAQPESADGRLIPDIAIPFDAMKKVNASIVADIAEFQRDTLYMSSVVLDAALQDGGVDVRDFRFNARSGQLAASGSLAPNGGTGKAYLKVVGRDMAFGLFDANLDLATTSNVDVNLRSSGTTVRSLAGNANGVAYVDMRGGLIVKGNPFIQAIYGDMLEEILNTINPFRKTDPYTDFECLIVPLTVTDGTVSGAPSAFASTSKIRLVAQGEVNLKDEKIRLSVRTTPRRIVSFSAAELVNPYIQIVGTLAAPRLAVDEAGVLITGGAAVATGGLSLLARGLWDRLSKSGDACGQMSQQALQELDGRLPDLVLEGPPPQE